MKSIITIVTLSFLFNFSAFAQDYIAQVKPSGQKLWGYVNSSGEMVIKPKFKKCYQFTNEGLAPIYEGKKFYFIDKKGETISTEITGFKMIEGGLGFGGLQSFSDGLVAVVKDKKWGYLNTDGKIAIKLQYDKVTSFENGFATAKKGNSYFVINKAGEETKIEGPGVYVVKRFSEGLAPYHDKDKVHGFVDTNGKVVIKAKFTTVGYFANGLAWAKTPDKKVGYINKTGEWAIKPSFLAAKNFDSVSGLARIKNETSWAYVNTAGELLKVTTETYGDFGDGLALGKKDGKVGYFNAQGEWVIKPQFEAGRKFKNGFAAVKKNGKWGFVNKSGELVVKAKFDGIKDMEKVN